MFTCAFLGTLLCLARSLSIASIGQALVEAEEEAQITKEVKVAIKREIDQEEKITEFKEKNSEMMTDLKKKMRDARPQPLAPGPAGLVSLAPAMRPCDVDSL